VVSFMPRPLYPEYPLDRKLGEPRAGLDAVAKKKAPAPAGNRTPVVQPVD
jgi:hypothetical protein